MLRLLRDDLAAVPRSNVMATRRRIRALDGLLASHCWDRSVLVAYIERSVTGLGWTISLGGSRLPRWGPQGWAPDDMSTMPATVLRASRQRQRDRTRRLQRCGWNSNGKLYVTAPPTGPGLNRSPRTTVSTQSATAGLAVEFSVAVASVTTPLG